MSETAPEQAGYQVRALERGLSVLVAFTAGRHELSLQDLHDQLSLNKATLVRLLDVLQRTGFMTQDAESGKYRLGMRAFEVGRAYLPNIPLEQLGQYYIRELSNATGQTANVGMLDGYEMIHIATYEPDRPLHFHTRVGMRGDLHCTGLGKVLGAYLEPEALDDYIARADLKVYTPATIATREALRAELERVRVREMAEDQEELVPGLRCIAVPIRNLTGKVVAALSISGPSADYTPETIPTFKALLIDTARAISERLGYIEQLPIGADDHRHPTTDT